MRRQVAYLQRQPAQLNVRLLRAFRRPSGGRAAASPETFRSPVARRGQEPNLGNTRPLPGSLHSTLPVSGILQESTVMLSVLKRKDFARWQAGEKLPDDALCRAVSEMANGLVDADLGGFLYKKRVARPGGGKSGGYRTVLSARIGDRYVFLHGFAKKDKANITQDEKKALQFAGKVFLDLSPAELTKALQVGVLVEVHCVQQAH